MPPLTLFGYIKLISAWTATLILLLFAPTVTKRPVAYVPPEQPTLNERVATSEEKIRDIKEDTTRHEAELRELSVEVASVHSTQTLVLGVQVPVVIFMLTHTAEIIQRMRKKE